MSIHRNVIANLESGRRPSVTVAEVLVLAEALKVPPIRLVYPVGLAATVEALPQCTADTWRAVRWFTGEVPLRESDRVDFEWESGAEPVEKFRFHERMVDAWRTDRQRVENLVRTYGPPAGGESADSGWQARDLEYLRLAEQAVNADEAALRDVREQMRSVGLTPPALPDALIHLDDPAR